MENSQVYPEERGRMYVVKISLVVVFLALIAHFASRNPWILREMADFLDGGGFANNFNKKLVYKEMFELLGCRCSINEDDLRKHGKDRSDSNVGYPDMIVSPETTKEVQKIIQICNKHNMIIVPQGFNSGVEGGSSPVFGGVVLSTKLMNKIEKLHEEDMQITVQSGIGIREMNEYLKKFGYVFNCLPNSYPSIGGAIATCASGLESLVYGTMKENVVSLEVVLPNGKIVKTRCRADKSSAGYDITSIFVGSEGTLGIITKATVKIYKMHSLVYAGIAVFDSLEDVVKSAIEVKSKKLQIYRMEILNGDAMKAVNKYFKDMKYPILSHMLFEIRGEKEELVQSVLSDLIEVFKKNNASDIKYSSDSTEREKLWHSRNKFFFALLHGRDNCTGCRFFHTDLCVPISSFIEVILETEKDFTKYFGHCPIVSHAGDGNFHVGLSLDYENQEELDLAHQCAKRSALRAVANGGTCSGEHGIGVMKKHFLEIEFGKSGVELMKTIKRAMDPRNMMNPGKVVDI